MRIGFVGHAHHRTTGSSRFFLDALRGLGEVELRWDEGGATDLAPLCGDDLDAVVVWQVEEAALRLARSGRPNVTFFPMFDSCREHPDSFWRALAPIKVVSFSEALRARLERIGLRARGARFFPEVPAERASEAAALSGYLWQRRQDVTWHTLRPLLAGARFERFTLHDAPDPHRGELALPSAEEAARLGLRITRWFPSPEAARADRLAHNVYFAPRLHEGIGMSFLEAMALGQLVVAPDAPTMNEYVVSGVNGLLYDPARPAPLDLRDHLALGRRAREFVAAGRERWLRDLPALLEFVAAPPRRAAPRPAPPPARPPPADLAVLRAGADLNLDGAGDGWAALLAEGEELDLAAAREALGQAPPAAEVIVGHAVARDGADFEEPCRAAEPARALAALRRAEVAPGWIEAFPRAAAVLWRAPLLRRLGLRAEAGELGREDALLRALAAGARVHHALAPLAAVPLLRPPRRRRLRRVEAWRRIARAHGDPAAVDRAFEALRRAEGAPALDRLTGPELLAALPFRAGALRELKRRLRRRRTRAASPLPG